MKNKSTYSLLLAADAEEKGRSIFETVIYSLVVLSTVVSVWSFASGDVTVPGQTSVKKDAPASMMANAPALNPARG